MDPRGPAPYQTALLPTYRCLHTQTPGPGTPSSPESRRIQLNYSSLPKESPTLGRPPGPPAAPGPRPPFRNPNIHPQHRRRYQGNPRCRIGCRHRPREPRNGAGRTEGGSRGERGAAGRMGARRGPANPDRGSQGQKGTGRYGTGPGAARRGSARGEPDRPEPEPEPTRAGPEPARLTPRPSREGLRPPPRGAGPGFGVGGADLGVFPRRTAQIAALPGRCRPASGLVVGRERPRAAAAARLHVSAAHAELSRGLTPPSRGSGRESRGSAAAMLGVAPSSGRSPACAMAPPAGPAVPPRRSRHRPAPPAPGGHVRRGARPVVKLRPPAAMIGVARR